MKPVPSLLHAFPFRQLHVGVGYARELTSDWDLLLDAAVAVGHALNASTSTRQYWLGIAPLRFFHSAADTRNGFFVGPKLVLQVSSHDAYGPEPCGGSACVYPAGSGFAALVSVAPHRA